jgi:lysophospholipase L1-like esterase
MKKSVVRILLSILIFIGLDLLTGLLLIPDNFNAFRTRHYYYHHGLLPNQETLAAWGALIYPMYTNSMGLIDSAVYRLPRESNNHRILILGDSHSEGVGVPYPRTFAGRLANSLKAHGIEVINGSAVSYSQKIEYLKAKFLIEKEGLRVDEIFLLVDISDLQNELVYEAFEPKDKSDLGDFLFRFGKKLKKRSAVYYLVDEVHTQRARESFFQSIGNFYENVRDNPQTNVWEIYSDFFSHFNDKVLLSNPRFHGMGNWMEDDTFRELAMRGIKLGQDQVVKLKALCDAYGIRLTISVHPWHYQINKGVISNEYVQLWEDFAKTIGIDFINLFPLFVNTDESPETVIKKYYIRDDNHWNEFGHEKVARHLASYILEKTAL